MPLNAETDKILKDLESQGFDMSAIRKQAQGNPLLENAANATLGGGLLRRQEFVTYKEQKDKEVQTLQSQVTELAALKDNLGDFKDNKELYQAALDKIEVLTYNLEEAGFDPKELKELTLKERTGLGKVITQAKEADKGNLTKDKEEERIMPNNDDYVKSEDLQTVLANLAGGSLIGGIRAQRQLIRAQQLGIEVTDELATKFEQNLLKGLEAGKTYDAIADETFGFAAKIKEQDDAKRKEEIDTQVRTQVAERLKEAGVSSTTLTNVTKGRGLVNTLSSRVKVATGENAPKLEGEGGFKVVGGRQVPVNKHGDVEFYRLRGEKSDRMQAAVQELTSLEQSRPELFDDV